MNFFLQTSSFLKRTAAAVHQKEGVGFISFFSNVVMFSYGLRYLPEIAHRKTHYTFHKETELSHHFSKHPELCID